jgi:hypothetical protein
VGFVGDGPVVGDPVQLRRFGLPVVGDLGNTEFNLVRLGLLGEDGAECLGVDVGELPAADVTTVIGVAAGVGVLDATAAQAVELVESTDRGESDAVVDLADLLQRTRWILGHEQHAAGVGQRHHTAATGDSFTGDLRPLPHRLLRGDEVRKTHESDPIMNSGPHESARGASLFGRPPGPN